MDVNERIRARIRAEMNRQGMSQAELARQLGIKPPSLSQVLSGKYGHMPQSLMDVLEALGLTLEAVPVANAAPVPEHVPEAAPRRGRKAGKGQDAEGER
jgi:transcriptional regulator with XRE-family HTH domain